MLVCTDKFVQANNALIDACTKSNQHQKAREVFQTMQQKGLEPNVVTYEIFYEK